MSGVLQVSLMHATTGASRSVRVLHLVSCPNGCRFSPFGFRDFARLSHWPQRFTLGIVGRETIKILPSLRPRVNMFESGRSVASLGQNDGLRGILSLMVFRSLEGFFCQADSAFRPSEFVSFVILVGFEKKPRGSFRNGLCWATDHGAALRVCLASIVCVCGRCGSSPLTSRIAPDGSSRSGPV